MKLKTTSFEDGQSLDSKFSFCKKVVGESPTFSENLNPDLTWSDVPKHTKSFVIICHDETCPTEPDDVNQAGREVPEELPRADFFHWLLTDIPADRREIASGDFSQGVTSRGKSKHVPFGRTGRNDYTGWFNGDEAMEGDYFGYDGPCPPWNDSLVHTYHFTIFALDINRCDLPEGFQGNDLRSAIEGHILESASLSCTYTLNPRLD